MYIYTSVYALERPDHILPNKTHCTEIRVTKEQGGEITKVVYSPTYASFALLTSAFTIAVLFAWCTSLWVLALHSSLSSVEHFMV